MGPAVSIYAISDPASPGVPRYIGATSRKAQKRFGEHVRDVRRGLRKIPAHEWMSGLVAEGVEPEFTVLAVVPSDCADEFEARFIAAYRDSLLNRQSGGRAGHVASDETRAKMAARMAGNQFTKGAELTAEHRAKISAAITGITRSEETRAKMGAAKAGVAKSEEHRKKLSGALSGKPWSAARRAAHELKKLKD